MIHTTEEGKRNPRNEFWTSAGIERARKGLDVWASCKWARREGTADVPTLAAIFDRVPEVTVLVWEKTPFQLLWDRESKQYVKMSRAFEKAVTLTPRTSEPFQYSSARVIEWSIDVILKDINSLFAANLLMQLYPRSGPYEKEPSYRPSWIYGELEGGRMDRHMERGMQQMEREILRKIRDLV